jgi:hypothetical protein
MPAATGIGILSVTYLFSGAAPARRQWRTAAAARARCRRACLQTRLVFSDHLTLS